MFKYFWVALALVLFSATSLEKDFSPRFFWIVWNVGQGQWSTLVTDQTCFHFDMGGEKSPLSKAAKICRGKSNRILLSHWDWDHVSFALKAQKHLANACLDLPPLGSSSFRKMKILKAYVRCSRTPTTERPWQELTHFTNQDLNKRTNDLSHVLFVSENFLIPGDSPVAQEKIWSQNPVIAKTKFLLLGHHGSRTSTSETLLWQLPRLKLAVVSARFARYGHPHQEVVQRLKKYQVPLLKTEDWGNLWFETPKTNRY